MTSDAWSSRVAVITGGADGLGFALARRLAGLGAHPVLFDIAADKLDRARRELGDLSRAFRVDVTRPDEVRAAVARIEEEFGRIDALVNAAGITGTTRVQSHEVALDDFDRVMNLNVRACLVTFQAVMPGMLRRRYGRVLHISSIAGKEGNAGMLAYSASKAAVIGMTKVQGKEYAETGVTVNAIAPAVIRTEIHTGMPEEQIRYMTDKIPMKRCGTLDEFAAVAAFILSPENSFTTGFTYDLSGGRAVY